MSIGLKSLAAVAALATGCGAALAADAVHPSVVIQKEARSGVQVGVLSCKSPGSIGYILGSSKELACEYRPAGARYPVDAYLGTLGKIGVDVGATGPSVLQWAVVAHSDAIGPGDLAGSYRGASASAAALVGGGANVLVGGSRSTISLQPLSLEGQTGISVAAGLSTLRLDPI
ncbi:hypothetical protein GCM10008171_16810 [Methylopila jiangsuensis]|uniref:DUF992 domain-containing protein n=1 Tax=Methylopila jiangsuensis TaxID=586230 RepID=A0A9W6JFS4_9HYPH|nr:DUF992 domain-containing protein [Methylopila jiangsuensis]MDR6284060.1 hypothetical protein [Methylopila jiangsuensis]GLK76427.1 hypothetical protein GCM10008171_16810 [Methylopila jiangsuensis]